MKVWHQERGAAPATSTCSVTICLPESNVAGNPPRAKAFLYSVAVVSPWKGATSARVGRHAPPSLHGRAGPQEAARGEGRCPLGTSHFSDQLTVMALREQETRNQKQKPHSSPHPQRGGWTAGTENRPPIQAGRVTWPGSLIPLRLPFAAPVFQVQIPSKGIECYASLGPDVPVCSHPRPT